MRFAFFLFAISLSTILSSQTLTDSNLPIMVIDTDDQSIPDEPKMMARMGIVNNVEGSRNRIDDEYNEYDGWIGIERRGSTSQIIFPKIGYGFETRLADGSNNNVSLLGMPEENDWVLHGPYSDKTLIRSALAYKLAEQIMPYAPRTRFIELVIDDEYLGVYVLIEKIKRDGDRVDVPRLNADENEGDDLTGGYIIKHDKGSNGQNSWDSKFSSLSDRDKKSQFLYHYPKPDDITEAQKDYIQSYVDTLENILKSPDFNDPINGYEKYIDVESFIDFMWVNEISRNVDGYRLSTFMYKDKESSEDGRLHMGPVWDFNLAFGNANYCDGGSRAGWAYNFNQTCPDDFWVIHFWWERLHQDERFRAKAKERWLELRANQWSDERLQFQIDSMTNLLEEAQGRNFIKWNIFNEWIWPNNFVGNNYSSEVRYMTGWLEERLQWLDERIDDYTNPTYDPIGYEIPNVYPNPTTGSITIDYYASVTHPVRITFYNAQGQLVNEFNDVQPRNNENSVQMELPPISGLYFYIISFGEEREQSGKIFVER
ncbi:MAG: CotH kinase family protein [Saprospiraceae bacterium]